MNDDIAFMLRRRGIRAMKYAPRQGMMLPEGCPRETEDALYRLMAKYSFRLFLRDVITHIDDLRMEHLTKYCSQNAAQRYLAALLQQKMLREIAPREHVPAAYRLTNERVRNIGGTLEWFVAEALRREFGCSAAWGMRLKASGAGGDYDVIASVEGRLAYIEVKSSPPKHLEFSEIHAFFERVMTLRPELAIFLEDTHLRMNDKLVPLFEEELRQRFGSRAAQDCPVCRLKDELFAIRDAVFLINTKPDLIGNIGVCLAQFLGSRSMWR